MMKVALIVLIVVISAVGILFAGLALVEKNDVDRLDSSSLYPIVKERWSNNPAIKTEQDASSLLGFDVKFPTLIDYNIGLVTIESHDDSKQLFLFYTKNPIRDKMRLNEFFSQNGILLIYQKNSDDPNSWVSHRLELLKNEQYNAYQISINGNQGVVISERDRISAGQNIHDPSQIEFVKDEVRITVQAYRSESELIKVAESIN